MADHDNLDHDTSESEVELSSADSDDDWLEEEDGSTGSQGSDFQSEISFNFSQSQRISRSNQIGNFKINVNLGDLMAGQGPLTYNADVNGSNVSVVPDSNGGISINVRSGGNQGGSTSTYASSTGRNGRSVSVSANMTIKWTRERTVHSVQSVASPVITDRLVGDRDVGRGLSIEEIERLPTSEYLRPLISPDNSDFVAEECQICLSAFELSDTTRTLPCLHRFHKLCIDKWLKEKLICPICKLNVRDQLGNNN